MTVHHHTVQVPATSANIGPGYDAFGVALDLHLAVRSLPRGARSERVMAGGEGATEVVTGDDNLVWRALVAFCETHDLAVPDVALQTMNRIPLERGLGSSSSAIVAGLMMGRALTGARVGERAIVELATELEGHPDNVAPAVLGGLVVCSRGDDATVVTRRVNPTPRLRPILFVPTARQSTSEARAVLPDHLDVADVVLQASRAGHVLGALTGLWPVDPGLSGDRLHEPARAGVMAPSARLLGSLREVGAHAWLSGAGPSVAAAVPDGTLDRPLVERCLQLAADEGFVAHLLGFDLSGALACPDDGCGLTGQQGCVQCPRERLS